jgi:FkbM family methyltransferase
MSFPNPFETPDFVHAVDVQDVEPALKLLTFPGGFRCYSDAVVTGVEIMYNEVCVRKEYLRHAPPFGGMRVVVDAGANIGLFSLLAKRENPSLAVYAFEPVRETYAILARNVALNRLNDVHLYNAALGSGRPGSKPFVYYRNASVNSTAHPEYLSRWFAFTREKIGKEFADWAAVSENRTVEVQTLSSVIRDQGIPSIDFLKIDTEGDEAEVLDGIDEEHFGIIRNIAIEIHSEDLHRGIRKRLAALGYRLHSEAGLAEFAGNTNLFATRQA